jgi:nucleotide-binding universal stress UspA family protein
VGVDGSYRSLAALDVAADEAAWRRRPLRIAYAYPATSQDPTATAEPPIEDRWMATDAMFRALARHPDLEVTTQLTPGTADNVLLAQSEAAALLVVGSHGGGALTGLLSGGVSTRIASQARCPVIVVVRGEHAASGGRVLLGVDGARPSLDAVAFAFEEAAQRGVPLTALYAWFRPHRADGDLLDPVADGYAPARSAAVRELDVALGKWPDKYPDVPVRREVIYSLDPVSTLVDASSRASIVVVGSRRRGDLRGLLLGSVGLALVRQGACSVAVVHGADLGALLSPTGTLPGSP